jgi:ammonium transporter, Amt family
MPLFDLGVLILWLGWFGFNLGSTLTALDGRFPTIAMITQLAGSAGVVMAMIVMYAKTKTFDIGMAGNGAIAGLVAITGPAGYIEPWAAPIIGGVAGLDISEHGMYGYPEQFIPAPELVGYGAAAAGTRFGTGPMSDPEVTTTG